MGIFDHGYVWTRKWKKDKLNNNPEWREPLVIDDKLEKSILIFLGWRKKYDENVFEKLYTFFPERKKVIYELPNTILSSDPETAASTYKAMTEHALDSAQKNNADTVFGMSIGSTLALYVANRYSGIDDIRLTLPGYKIASTVWEACVTKKVVKDAESAGYSKSDFGKKLSDYDPVNNISNINFLKRYLGSMYSKQCV